jgi:hypothetical protein
MTEPVSTMIVERVDHLDSRPQWIFVTGVLSGYPLSRGDAVTVCTGDAELSTTIEAVEIHTRPGKTTIMLASDLRPNVTTGTAILR